VLGFESADHPLDAWMTRALELVADHGGQFDADGAKTVQSGGSGEQRDDAASTWRNAFLRMPYYRDRMAQLGVIADTFETAITWDRFDELYTGVYERVADAIQRITGHPGRLSCRFTHIYPDGPAPYFSYSALGSDNGDLQSSLDRWRAIKAAASEAVVSLGGTITHHHAVGRDHRPGYEQQSPPLFRQALAAAKHSLDPHGILNPGVLIDPLPFLSEKKR
jgi:alkyldihydroxyacetonephosphate synthase